MSVMLLWRSKVTYVMASKQSDLGTNTAKWGEREKKAFRDGFIVRRLR